MAGPRCLTASGRPPGSSSTARSHVRRAFAASVRTIVPGAAVDLEHEALTRGRGPRPGRQETGDRARSGGDIGVPLHSSAGHRGRLGVHGAVEVAGRGATGPCRGRPASYRSNSQTTGREVYGFVVGVIRASPPAPTYSRVHPPPTRDAGCTAELDGRRQVQLRAAVQHATWPGSGTPSRSPVDRWRRRNRRGVTNRARRQPDSPGQVGQVDQQVRGRTAREECGGGYQSARTVLLSGRAVFGPGRRSP